MVTENRLDRMSFTEEMLEAKYAAFILAVVRLEDPDLFGWYEDEEEYLDTVLDYYRAGREDEAADRAMPLRLYVDTADEREAEMRKRKRFLDIDTANSNLTVPRRLAIFRYASQQILDNPPIGFNGDSDALKRSLEAVIEPYSGDQFLAA